MTLCSRAGFLYDRLAMDSAVLGQLAIIVVVLAIGMVLFDFLRQRHQERPSLVEVEDDARAHGGWYVWRNGAVFRLADEGEFAAACADGRIYPSDRVFTPEVGEWQRADEVSLPDLVFSAASVRASSPPASNLGCVVTLIALGIVSTVGQLTEPLAMVLRRPVAEAVTGLLQVAGLVALWVFVRRRK
jgi:hypothetical protein